MMESLPILIFLAHLLSCVYMTGIIFLIHFAHYPGFASVDEKAWLDYHRHHTRAMGALVGPVMILELATAFFLPLPPAIKWVNVLALVVIWALTFLGAVPCHDRLQAKKCHYQISLLLKFNRGRMILWPLRSFVLIYFFCQYLVVRS